MHRRLAAVALFLLVVMPIGANALPFGVDDLTPRAVEGNAKVVVLLLQFQDVKAVHTPAHVQNLYFGEGDSERTVRDYLLETSGGNLELGGFVVPMWFTSQHKMAQYGNGHWAAGERDSTFDPLFEPVYSCSMALEAMRLADPHVDFSQFVDPLSGTVKVAVIHAGTPQNMGTTDLDVWPHMWSHCDENGRFGTFTFDGVGARQYMTNSEFSSLGTNAHELGHLLLGLPDLYHGGNPVQGWDLMGSGGHDGTALNEPLDTKTTVPTGQDPAHLGAWSKMALGWVVPELRKASDPVALVQLAPAERDSGVRALRLEVDTDVCTTIRMPSPWAYAYDWGGGDRYFLIEYRTPEAGDYDGDRGTPGVVAWFVDECANQGSWWDMNTESTPRVRVLGASDRAMDAGDAMHALGVRSSTIDGRRTGWFVEVVDVGETATVRVGTSDADVTLLTPSDDPSLSTSRMSRSTPSAYARVDETTLAARGPSVMTKDSPIRLALENVASWSVLLEGDTTVTPTCTESVFVTCQLPRNTPAGEYVLRVRASDASGTERRIDFPVQVI